MSHKWSKHIVKLWVDGREDNLRDTVHHIHHRKLSGVLQNPPHEWLLA